MKKRLIKIADFLDKAGQTEDANFVDEMIFTLPQPTQSVNEELEIPQEEYDTIKNILESLKSSFKE
jgi:hypothetical protein